MNQFKEWMKHHKALAIGGGIALIVLLYLWLRSGSSSGSGASSSNAALQSYYAAEASSQQGAAAQVIAQDQLQAQENATNVAGQTYQAAITAQSAPYQAQLDAITQLANLQAYQDYLGETGGGNPQATYLGPASYGAGVPGGPSGWNSQAFSIGGQTVYKPDLTNVPLSTPVGTVVNVPGTTSANTTPPLQPGQFQGFSAPTL